MERYADEQARTLSPPDLEGIAKWACFNGGSNIPADSNGVKSASPVTVHIVATDQPRRNGNISQSFTMDLTPTAAQAGLSCKGGQVIALYSFRLLDPAAFALVATSDQGSSSVIRAEQPAVLPRRRRNGLLQLDRPRTGGQGAALPTGQPAP